MSSLLDRITSRLDRLRAPPPEVKRPARKAILEPAPEPSKPAEPLTIPNLRAALDRLAGERERQLGIINGAEAERDRIMDADDGDDAELLAIDRRVALARLALDRLARLEAEAFDQLAPLEFEGRQNRWAHARDEYLKLMQDVHGTMEAYERAANRLWSFRSRLFEAVGSPGWDDVVPKLPHFGKAAPGVIGLMPYDSHRYRAEAERFSTLMIGAPQVNNFAARLARYVEGKLDLDELASTSRSFGGTAADPAEHPVLVRLSRSITLADEVLAMGTVVKVRAAHARDLVAANRVVLTDTLTALSGARPAGAGQQVCELPLPPAPAPEALA